MDAKSANPTVIDLQQRMSRIYDHLYANAPVRTPTAIANEVSKILHTAMFIEETRPRLLAEQDLPHPAFSYSQNEAKRLLVGGSLSQELAQSVRKCFNEMNNRWNLYDEGIILGDADLAYTCAQLNGLVVSDRNRDICGDALEVFRSQWAKRAGGQFFTDPQVTSLAMVLLDFNPFTGDDLVDICAGSGGFLLAALKHTHDLLDTRRRAGLDMPDLASMAPVCLKGQEVDPEICEVANATLQSRLGKSTLPLVTLGDSLIPNAFNGHGRIALDTHLCAATNPPFGTKITVKDEAILRSYELAVSGNARRASRLQSRPPDILFLEQNIRILKPGVGRLAIVLAYHTLSGPQTLYVREWLLRHAQVMAVVDLPAETFQPHTGTKATLLVVRRRQEPLRTLTEVRDPPIFMSMPKWIGHDRRGNPVYARDPEGIPTSDILCDFDPVKHAFRCFADGNDPHEAHTNSFALDPAHILRAPGLQMNAAFHKPGSRYHSHESMAAEGWQIVKLYQVVKKIFYPGRFKRNYVEYYPGAVPFLGGANISQLNPRTNKWLRHNDPRLDELKVHAGWILVTRSGSTGIVSTVPQTWDGYAMSEHIIRIIPDPRKLAPEYLQAFLRTAYAQEMISRGVFGSVIDEIDPEAIGNLSVPIPSSEEFLRGIVRGIQTVEKARETAEGSLKTTVEDLDRMLAKRQLPIFPVEDERSLPSGL